MLMLTISTTLLIISITILDKLVVTVNCWQDYEVESLGQINDTGELFIYSMKARRINRTTYAITGTYDLKQDLRNYTVEGRLFYSSNGNRQYVQSPLKMSPKPFCDAYNTEYRKYVMENIHEFSNFPYSSDSSVDLCTLFPPATYYVKNYIFDKAAIPKYVSNGLYRLELLFALINDSNSVPVDGFYIVSRLY